MRAVSLLMLTALAGCASSGRATNVGPPPVVETVRVVGGAEGGGTISIRKASAEAGTSTVARLAASPDEVWRVLPVVYESLGISITTSDFQSRTLGNPDFSARRRLGTAPMGRFLDCGNTQGAPSADTYDVRLSVLSRVTPGETGGTMLTTTIDAMARPVAFSGEYVRCSSTRVLESRIAEAVKTRLTP